jgi:hypothetical protein
MRVAWALGESAVRQRWPMGKRMGEIVNLRKVRKDVKKRQEDDRAAANRIVHGRSKAERTLETKRASILNRHLDRHKIESGDA